MAAALPGALAIQGSFAAPAAPAATPGMVLAKNYGNLMQTVKPITISAIDVHGHYGNYIISDPPLYGQHILYNEFMTADAAQVARRGRLAGIEWTVVSPLLGLFPFNRANAATGNDEAFGLVPKTPGLRQWVIVNPLQPATYAQAEAMLKSPWCVGIKIHPEVHGYPIRDHGRSLFEFAARLRAVVLTHSGDPNSLPFDLLPFADSFPEVRLILAHLGHGSDLTLQVRAIQASRHGNVFVDTSSGNSIISGLVEWAVREIGADRILFGTDTPCYFAAMQRMRIEQAEIKDDERRKILSENARRLLSLN
jgi:hypothetical protein